MENKYKIGVNVYGLRYLLMDGVFSTISLIREYGFDCIEPMVKIDDRDMNENPKYPNLVWSVDFLLNNIEKIKQAGIDIKSVHCIYDCDTEAKILAKNIKKLSDMIGINYFVFADAQLTTLTDCLMLSKKINEIADEINDKKIILLYHPHENEFIEYNHKYLIDHLLENSPELMLQIDIGWVKFAGIDVFSFMLKHNEKIKMIHFKDLIDGYGKEIRKTSFTGIGKGVVECSDILNNLNMFDLDEFSLIICQDNSNTDLGKDLSDGVSYIKKIIEERGLR